MKKWMVVFTLIAFGVVIAACGSNQENTAESFVTSEEDEQAYAIFQQNCVSCHASDLSGNMGAASNLQQVGSRLSQEEIANVITNGKGQMPAQSSRVTPEEIQALSVWLAKLQ